MTYDNDIFFITDQYYTSGVNFSISKSFQSTENARKVYTIDYGHKIITPLKIREPELSKRDRPFAGWHYMRISQRKISAKFIRNFTFEMGLVGENSGMGNFQKWYHDVGGIAAPLGWEYQITNEFISNFQFGLHTSIFSSRYLDAISSSNLSLGNGLVAGAKQVTLRFGKFNPLSNSEFARARISNESASSEEEFFLFYGLRGRYVAHDIFIEGSLFDNPSPHTVNLEHWQLVQHWGVMYSNKFTSFTISFYRMSKEVTGGRHHQYVSFGLGLRF